MIDIYTVGTLKNNWRLNLPKIEGIKWTHPKYADDRDFRNFLPRDLININKTNAIFAQFFEGIPSHNSAVEVGIAYAKGIPIYSVIPEGLKDQLCFLAGLSTATFVNEYTALEAIEFIVSE